MAKRKGPKNRQGTMPEHIREKIKASALVNRLQDHVLGNLEMTQTQIAAAKTLLDRVSPTLRSVESKATVEHIVTREEAEAELRRMGVDPETLRRPIH